jgi:hypothetical protein
MSTTTEWSAWVEKVSSATRPISPAATPRNRARWAAIEANGFVPVTRSGVGSWVHPDHPSTHWTTAAARRYIEKETT